MPHTTDTDGALFERLRPRLKAISCRIVGSEAEAEDVVQDCFLKWRAAGQASLTTPVAWLTTVVQHHSVDRLRRRARDASAARAAMELVPEVAPSPPEEGLIRRGELGEALARLLACLSPSERLALVLHEVFEFEHADIAAALGTSSVNARQYLARARRRLRRLGAEGEVDADAPAEAPLSEKLCRERLRRFQAAINGLDVAAMVTLLADEQPMSVVASPHTAPTLRIRTGACANDAWYRVTLAA
jgi:RNA polymerase sigma-70 factor (ECF subfamily)